MNKVNPVFLEQKYGIFDSTFLYGIGATPTIIPVWAKELIFSQVLNVAEKYV